LVTYLKKYIWVLIVISILALLLTNWHNLLGDTRVYKMAIVMPGTIYDKDYNQLAFIAGENVKNSYGIPVSYSEEVSVPSVTSKVEKLNLEKINIIWLHGSQYASQVYSLANKYPNIVFIMEGDVNPDVLPENVWYIDRNFQIGMYILGRLAAEVTNSGKVGYICGLNLPFSYIETNAIKQGFRDSGKNVALEPVWVGDFNEPVYARLATLDLINNDNDVIIGSLNLGMEGVIEEVNQSDQKVYLTTKYTDKSALSPHHYLTSLIMDFKGPLNVIINQIIRHKTTGYFPFDLNNGIVIQTPIQNVTSEINTKMNQVIADVRSGKTTIQKDSSP
jgi:basic membrane protein A and related proteins